MLLRDGRTTAGATRRTVIDYFALALTHALILLALIRVVGRAELDREPDLNSDRKRAGKRADTASQQRGDNA